ncbi:carboxypeptidase-like regulatory domain-containing protein [Flavobacterium sp. K5-23]|uniref:carboxypeptidase-like regulatory domain-containing protein n=1 Tax=Flavobacterium sp. K5-23 TaxID=2746225 RepID=UPI0020100821|nr:carboxypeptidase-like regulatory domain-containing protein [Flavobacterium sp. K5-23]UQD55078.1 carboxypeptidase-like regulatory domain-containing protein [Flavobacterium sp. K5-23]
MNNKNTFLVILILLITQLFYGQVTKQITIQGVIVVENATAESINIVNQSSKLSAVSDKNGLFSILVKEGDVLVFSAVNLVTLHKTINNQDLTKEFISILMVTKSIDLDEVVINEYPQITAENLGIIPYGQKKYTPAERKLYTATSGGGIDGLLNAISGRKAMLKKNIIVEKKGQALNRLAYLFEDKYYIESLKIPVDYIQGFQYYCVENGEFVESLNTRNKTLSMFLIVSLAKNYNQINQNEN